MAEVYLWKNQDDMYVHTLCMYIQHMQIQYTHSIYIGTYVHMYVCACCLYSLYVHTVVRMRI